MPRTDKIILLSGDYAQRLDALYSAAMNAREDESPQTLADGDPYANLRAEYDAVKAEAEANGTVVEMTAVGRGKWRELKEKHPARIEGAKEIIDGDRIAGVNADTVEDDLVFASVTSPEFTSRAAFDEWADALSEGEWQTLLVRAWDLANGSRINPKALPASRTTSTA